MRIAILTNFIPPYRLPLFAAVQALGDEVGIFVSTPMESGRAWQADWGTLTVALQRTISFKRRHRHEDLYEEIGETHIPLDTITRLRDFRPDAVVSGELGSRTMFALLYRRANPDARLLIWATVSERTERARSSRLRKAFRRMLIRSADAVLVNGASGRRYIEGLGCRPESIHELPYSVDHAHFSGFATRDPATAHRILIVSQLTARKGVARWLETVRRWASDHGDRNVEVEIAGDGEERGRLERTDWPPNLTVRLLGTVAYNDLPALYRERGILAFPTLADEWGVVVNEAMATGLPVLGSVHSQAVEEMVSDGETGWQFDPESADDAYRALERALATETGVLDHMRTAAMQTVERFSPEECARRLHAACEIARNAK